jgi:hypothetical protein
VSSLIFTQKKKTSWSVLTNIFLFQRTDRAKSPQYKCSCDSGCLHIRHEQNNYKFWVTKLKVIDLDECTVHTSTYCISLQSLTVLADDFFRIKDAGSLQIKRSNRVRGWNGEIFYGAL